MRVLFSFIVALSFAAALVYFAFENQQLVSVNLGLPGRQPQLYVWEIALFPAIATLVVALLSMAIFPRRPGRERRLMEAAQTQIQEQNDRLSALEARLRVIETLTTSPAGVLTAETVSAPPASSATAGQETQTGVPLKAGVSAPRT